MSTSEPSIIETKIEPPRSRAAQVLRFLGWTAFTLFCLFLFTLRKLPNEPIKNYLDSQLVTALSPFGIQYQAGEGNLSFGLGISYTLKDVSLEFRPPLPRTHLDEITVSPSFSALLLGRLGAKVRIQDQGSNLTLKITVKDTRFSGSFQAKKFNLAKLGVFPLATNLQLSAILDGKGSLSGNSTIPSSLEGIIDLRLTQAQLDPQMIAGFSIPKISISEATLALSVENGKGQIKTFQVGKGGDDLRATVTGDFTLAKQWASSNLNLKTNFALSESVMKSFILLDALLGAGKQSDGSYSFQLTGSPLAPTPTPLPRGGS